MCNLPQKKQTNKDLQVVPTWPYTQVRSAPGCLSAMKAPLAPGISAGVTTQSPPQGAMTPNTYITRSWIHKKEKFISIWILSMHTTTCTLTCPACPCPLFQPRERPARGRERAVVSGVVYSTQWIPGSNTAVGKHTTLSKSPQEENTHTARHRGDSLKN